MKLELIERESDGKKCIAPFIDGYNVWDIPKDKWCPAVADAILHAYELGFNACKSEMSRIQSPILFGMKFKAIDNY